MTAEFIEERQKKLDIGTRGKIKDNTYGINVKNDLRRLEKHEV